MEEDLIPESHRLEDLHTWLRKNALLQDDGAQLPRSDLLEERERFENYFYYQQSIHESIFANQQAIEQQQRQERVQILNRFRDVHISLLCADGVIRNVPLKPLAESCETVFTWAQSWCMFNSSDSDKEKQFVLDHFCTSSCQAFMNLIDRSDQSELVDQLTPEQIVDCIRIAHYLQNTNLLNELEHVLMDAIDTDNCLSLCQLADQLGLTSLFEYTLSHMVRTLGDLEETEVFDDLTPELKDRISCIRGALQSSVNSSSRLFFASLDEYLAIFAERVQYFRERLVEAKEQHKETQNGTHYWYDVQRKIEHQEQRVRTLEIAYREQKKLFTQKSTST
jgi:hypothetical protein